MAGGAAPAVVEPEAWVGAAGAAGVEVVGRAGVSGTLLEEADEAAGAGFGYGCMSNGSMIFTLTEV